MKRAKSIILLIAVTLCMTARSNAQETTGSGLSARAQISYPHSPELPDDVMWTREVYRTLDLTKDENGSLYYPTEPVDNRVNLFTLMFKLIATKKIPAYEYRLDGNERFSADSEIKLRDILDRFSIYYEQKRVKGRADSVLVVDNSDVPSADVQSMFIKEVWYFDQRTSSYGAVVTALCPVMHRSEEFSSERVKLPMFWVRYQDIAPYLAGTAIMSSSYNNTLNSSMDDFFSSRRYKGDIYKTTNLRNLSIAQYCESDSAQDRERQRIEDELIRFEKSLYGNDTISINKSQQSATTKAATKSPATKVTTTAAKQQEVKRNSKKKGAATTASGKSSTSSAKKKSPGSSSSSAPKASVRRERR
jgi:gliding motility associated protien GldN